MIIQPIVNTAEICAQHGIKQVVICPGSRSGPIALAFSRHTDLETFVIPDERSAGFIALGLAQSSNKPIVIVCTSGTATANLYPAIIEAYYQQVPLLIFTADRPPEWIDQQDGQTIRQQNIFQNHVLASYQFPVSFDHQDSIWESEKMISLAILKSSNHSDRMGPVHVNVPIREPFYPLPEEEYKYSNNIKIIRSANVDLSLTVPNKKELINELKKYKRIALVAGQTRISEPLKRVLDRIQQELNWLVIGDITSNVNKLENPITNHDLILQGSDEIESNRPDLIISFGQDVLSKSLKKYFRQNQQQEHWKVGPDSEIADTFKSLTKTIKVNPSYFFQLIEDNFTELSKSMNPFYDFWMSKEIDVNEYTSKFFETKINSEFHAVHQIMSALPKNAHLHLANSMPVRYANIIGLAKNTEITVWSNRGASGIDGCTSTSVGHAINSESLNILLSGDMAFFYDRNALWHNHLPDNIRIIILNNHGGGIFRLIEGPKQLKERDELFETRQNLNAENTAKDFHMNYFNVKRLEMLPALLDEFFDLNAAPAILEIETDSTINQKVYEDFMEKAKQI